MPTGDTAERDETAPADLEVVRDEPPQVVTEPARPSAAGPEAAEPEPAEEEAAEKEADEQKADEEEAAEPPPVVATEPAPRPGTVEPGPDEAPVVKDPLLIAVEGLRTQVAALSLGYELPGTPEARAVRENLLGQLDDYLLPRLRRRDAPLLAVIGGSTGAGKSTLTNSLLRREVSRSGVLRPTTRSPVLVHHPADSGAFLTQRILPNLTRVTSEAPEPMQPIDPEAPRITGLRLVPHEGLTPGLALIDAPDIDSLVDTNRDLAVQLLAAADLWLFVTTAARYADAMPWAMLQQAVERGVSVAIVLDRVPPEALAELRVHLATRLRERGLGSAPVFVVPESPITDGFLPAETVAPLNAWLKRVAGDERSRAMIAGRTLKGVVGSLPARVRLLADAADAQAATGRELRAALDEVVAAAHAGLEDRLTGGTALRGEVLPRWQDFMADGELLRRLDGGRRSLTERIGAKLRGIEPPTSAPLAGAVAQSVVDAVRSAARDANEQVLERWRELPAGRAMLDARGHLHRQGDIEGQLQHAVHGWRDHVLQLATEAAASVPSGRVRPDAETVAAVVMIAVLDRAPAQQPDEADADGVSPAQAAAAAAQRILGGVLGADQVLELAEAARADLVERTRSVLGTDLQRPAELLDARATTGDRGPALRAGADALTEAS